MTLGGTLSRATVRLHVDVNVGDPIWPEPQHVGLAAAAYGVLQVLGYPLEMVLAEKVAQLLPEVLLTPDGATLSTCMRWLCGIQ